MEINILRGELKQIYQKILDMAMSKAIY